MIVHVNNFMRLIGLNGVERTENPLAVNIDKAFKLLMGIGIILMPILWVLDKNSGNKIIQDWVSFGSWLIWFMVLCEMTIMTALVSNKKHYLLSNWLNMPILILTFPLILGEIPYAIVLRALQFVFIARYLSEIHQLLKRFFTVSHIGAIGVAFFIIVIVGGILMHSIDPNVKTVEDGMWWALVTMATLGYGDVIPVTTEGRLFGAVVIILGAVFFSLMTAQLAAYMVGEEELMREREILRVVHNNQDSLMELTQREDQRIENLLEKLSERMFHLESMIERMENEIEKLDQQNRDKKQQETSS